MVESTFCSFRIGREEMKTRRNRPKVLKPLSEGLRERSSQGTFLLSQEENWEDGEEDDWTDDEWGEDEGWEEEEW